MATVVAAVRLWQASENPPSLFVASGSKVLSSHGSASPDLSFHIRRNSHGNLHLVKLNQAKPRDFIGDDLESSEVFLRIDQFRFPIASQKAPIIFTPIG